MKKVFADAAYWIALINPRDQCYPLAKRTSIGLGPVIILTSELVLSEFLDFYCAMGPFWRASAGRFADSFYSTRNIRVVSQSTLDIRSAIALYRDRLDKDWSVTDCASFQIMAAESITEALTHDAHFEQAGFVALLRQGRRP